MKICTQNTPKKSEEFISSHQKMFRNPQYLLYTARVSHSYDGLNQVDW